MRPSDPLSLNTQYVFKHASHKKVVAKKMNELLFLPNATVSEIPMKRS